MNFDAEGMRRLFQAYRASDSIMFPGEDDAAAQVMREGFVQTFARAWDLQVQTWHGPQAFYCVDNPDPHSDDRLLPYFEHPDIRLLRMVADVLDGGCGAALYDEQPSIYADQISHYVEDFRVPPYRDLLQLRSSHMDRFVTALSESRAAYGPDDLGPWHPSNMPPF